MRQFFNSLKALFKRSPAPSAKATAAPAKASPSRPAVASEAVAEVKADPVSSTLPDTPLAPSDIQASASLWEEFARRLNTRIERQGPNFTLQVTGLYRDHPVQAGLYRLSEKAGGRATEESGAEWFAIRLTTGRSSASVSWALVYGVENWSEGARPDWFLACEDRTMRERLQATELITLMKQRQPIKAAFGHDQEIRFDAGEGTLTFRIPLGFALLAPSAAEFCGELDLLLDLAACHTQALAATPRQPAGAH